MPAGKKPLILTIQNSQEFEQLVQLSKKSPVFLLGWQNDCPESIEAKYIWENFAQDEKYHHKFVLAKVNVSHSIELAKRLGLTNTPKIKVIENQHQIAELQGHYSHDEYLEFLENHIQGDAERQLLTQAKALKKNGQHDKAIEVLTKFIDEHSKQELASLKFERIECHLNLGELGQANHFFEQLSVISRTLPKAKYLEALLYFYKQHFLSESPEESKEAFSFFEAEEISHPLQQAILEIPIPFLNGQINKAMINLLDIISKCQANHHWHQTHDYLETASKHALNLISLPSPELAKQYRRKIKQLLH